MIDKKTILPVLLIVSYGCSDSSFTGAGKTKRPIIQQLAKDDALPDDKLDGSSVRTGDGSVIEELDCKISVDRIGDTNRCRITASGIGSAAPTLLSGNAVVDGVVWNGGGAEPFTTETVCSKASDTVFTVKNEARETSCGLGIRKWQRVIGDGNPHSFGMNAIPGRPLHVANVTNTVRCEGTVWQQIAKENGFRSYVYDTSSPATDWRTMCKHNDGRYNYTSCHDNKHFDWNGTDWDTIPACTDYWTTRLTVYDPVPANFPKP